MTTWRDFITLLYPDALRRTYCVPPEHFNRVPYERRTVPGTDLSALVLPVPFIPPVHNVPPASQPSGSAAPVHSVPPVSQPSGSAAPVHSVPPVSQPSGSATPVHNVPPVIPPSGSAAPVHNVPPASPPSGSAAPVHNVPPTSQPSGSATPVHNVPPVPVSHLVVPHLSTMFPRPVSHLVVPHLSTMFPRPVSHLVVPHLSTMFPRPVNHLPVSSPTRQHHSVCGPRSQTQHPRQFESKKATFRDDTAQRHVLANLRALGDAGQEPMFILSQLNFGDYLNEPSYTAAVKTSQLPNLPRPEDLGQKYAAGDFDILLIHRRYGILVGELKAVGRNQPGVSRTPAQADGDVAKRVRNAVKQLDKSQRVVTHLVSDIAPGIRQKYSCPTWAGPSYRGS